MEYVTRADMEEIHEAAKYLMACGYDKTPSLIAAVELLKLRSHEYNQQLMHKGITQAIGEGLHEIASALGSIESVSDAIVRMNKDHGED